LDYYHYTTRKSLVEILESCALYYCKGFYDEGVGAWYFTDLPPETASSTLINAIYGRPITSITNPWERTAAYLKVYIHGNRDLSQHNTREHVFFVTKDNPIDFPLLECGYRRGYRRYETPYADPYDESEYINIFRSKGRTYNGRPYLKGYIRNPSR